MLNEFAKNAQLLSDNKVPPAGHWRYKMDSNRYAAGFLYNEQLNSATLNGILNRITRQLMDLLHANIRKIGLRHPGLAKWCKLSDIQQGIHTDKEGFLKKVWWNHYFSWLSEFFLRQDKLEDFFNDTEAPERGYFTGFEAQRVASLVYGINVPPMVVKNFFTTTNPNGPFEGETEVRQSAVVLFSPANSHFHSSGQMNYTLVKICANPNLTDIEVRTSSYYTRPIWRKIIPVIVFEQEMTYNGRRFMAGTKLVFPNGIRCVFKGNRILILEGTIQGGGGQSVSSATVNNFKSALASS